MSDDELLELIAEGDKNAEDLLVGRYKSFVENMARPYFLVGADQDDLVQIGMIGLLNAIRSYDAAKHASFKTYASVCVRHALLDAVREANARKNSALNNSLPLDSPAGGSDALSALPSPELSPEQQFIAKETEAALFDALSGVLGETDLNIIKLYLASMPYKEISKTLGITAKKVDNTIYYAKKKIEKLLKEMKK